jgi:hypothetical protein
VYTTSASFPSWHIEDAQPTLIHIQPHYQNSSDAMPAADAADAKQEGN